MLGLLRPRDLNGVRFNTKSLLRRSADASLDQIACRAHRADPN
jgi:hypothetical protein